jgi:hypothetical protein
MSILDSGVTPSLTLLIGFGILAGFFRKLLTKTVIILVVEIAFFVLFPIALLKFVEFITSIRHALG